MKEATQSFDTYDPYNPEPPQEIAERLVSEPQAGYVKVSAEGERILEPVTAEKSRLDFLIDQYGSTVVLVQTDSGYDVYVPEIFAKGKRNENH